MKSIFKLKEEPFNPINYLTSELAEEYYSSGSLPFTTRKGDGRKRIPHGYYSLELTFDQWLEYYNIKIL